MTSAELFNLLRTKFGEGAVLEHVEGVGDPFIVVTPQYLYEVASFLKHDPACRFDFCSNVTGIDWPDRQEIESVLHLYSYTHQHMAVIKAKLPRANPRVASVAALWPAADWHEREQYDMLGIIYVGHPNLRRILLAEDWEGFPLRKDFNSPEEIHGVSNLP